MKIKNKLVLGSLALGIAFAASAPIASAGYYSGSWNGGYYAPSSYGYSYSSGYYGGNVYYSGCNKCCNSCGGGFFGLFGGNGLFGWR